MNNMGDKVVLPDIGTNADIKNKYLTFYSDNQLFAVPIANIVQIIGVQKITETPESDGNYKGIINLRGVIISVMDTRVRLGKIEVEYTERACTIIANIDGMQKGFIVDAVDEVLDIDDDKITENKEYTTYYDSSILTGVATTEKGVILILDIDKFMS